MERESWKRRMDWKSCDVCGKKPCVPELECDHCHAPYCSEECREKDATTRKDIPGEPFPLASHSDFCPKLYDEQASSIHKLFECDPAVLKVFGIAWHSLPGPLSGGLPHALVWKGDAHYKPLLSAWLKAIKESKTIRSVSHFIADRDAARVMLFRMCSKQNNELLELWEGKKK